MSKVRVRYAPSPTGVLHIGGIRTALFNYLLAKNQKGDFILRIEDTDQKRLIPESIDEIKQSLELLSLRWDEYHVQSERRKIYHKYLNRLKAKGIVYEDEGAWRFRVEKGKKIEWLDGLHGKVKFESDVIEDFVIMKSDKFPTYHLANVVDDNLMNITHILRGDEWLSSTPKHLMLYEAFGWQPPIFIHLPVILGPNHKKLSKREGAKSALEYINEGYLPEALLNFLALLGWSPKDNQEIFSLEELVREFSIDRINKNSPIFNLEKLKWFNKKYLQKIPAKDLILKVKKFSPLVQKVDSQRLEKIVGLVKDRMYTLADFEKYAQIFSKKGSQKPPEKEKTIIAKVAIQNIAEWDEQNIAKQIDTFILKNNLDPADFKNTLRLAVFADNTPPIYQSLATLNQHEVIVRLDDAIKKAS